MLAIVAVSRNWVIGKDGSLPWRSRDDLRFFQEITTNKILIVGRKTFDNLPNIKCSYPYSRNVVVLTKASQQELNKDIVNKNGLFAQTINDLEKFESALPFLAKNRIICGGRQIYYQFIPKCSELYLTEFDFKVEEEGEIVKFPYTNLDLGAFFNRRDQIKEIENGRIWHYTK